MANSSIRAIGSRLMTAQLLQFLAATMVTAGLLILAIAQLPFISHATGMTGTEQLRILRPERGEAVCCIDPGLILITCPHEAVQQWVLVFSQGRGYIARSHPQHIPEKQQRAYALAANITCVECSLLGCPGRAID